MQKPYAPIIALLLLLSFAALPLPFHRIQSPELTPLPAGGTSAASARILILGDSITLQYLAELANQLRGCAVLHHFVEPERQTLAQWLFDRRHKPLNARHTEYLQGVLSRSAPQDTFDLVIVNVGLHNLKRATPYFGPSHLQRYAQDMRQILRSLFSHAPKVAFVATHPVGESAPSNFDNHRIMQMNAVMEALSLELGVEYLEPSSGISVPSNAFSQDGYHLSDEGAAQVTRQLRPMIVHLLNGQKDPKCRSRYPSKLPLPQEPKESLARLGQLAERSPGDLQHGT